MCDTLCWGCQKLKVFMSILQLKSTHSAFSQSSDAFPHWQNLSFCIHPNLELGEQQIQPIIADVVNNCRPSLSLSHSLSWNHFGFYFKNLSRCKRIRIPQDMVPQAHQILKNYEFNHSIPHVTWLLNAKSPHMMSSFMSRKGACFNLTCNVLRVAITESRML